MVNGELGIVILKSFNPKNLSSDNNHVNHS